MTGLFITLVILLLLSAVDGLMYGELMGRFWCRIGRHQFYDIHGGGWKDFYEPIDHCRLCKRPNKIINLKEREAKLRLVK